MHGAPLLHGVEIYHNRPIFYDLGNFIFNIPPTNTGLEEPIIWESVVAYVEFQGKNLQSITFRPIAMNKIGQGQPTLKTSTRIIYSSTHAACQSRPRAIKRTISLSGWLIPHDPSEHS